MSCIFTIFEQYIGTQRLFIMKITNKNLGEILKEAREQKGLTQEQLAFKVDKKRSYISKIESLKGNNIKVQTLIEIVQNGLDGEIEIKF